MIKFSIIIPAYNYSKFIINTINSVLSQPGDNWDLLVINDGSTDTSEILIREHLEHTQGAFKFISKANESLSLTRNRGIDETTGDYLLFLDADDTMYPGTMNVISSFITDDTYKMLAGSHINSFEDGSHKKVKRKRIPTDSAKAVQSYINHKFSLMSSATFLHRSVFDKIRYSPELTMSEDIPVFAKALSLYIATTLDYPFVIMKKHAQSMKNQVNLALETNLKVVDILFNPNILPKEIFKYKPIYKSIRCLSIARVCVKNKEYPTAQIYYKKAFKLTPFKLIRWRYLKKIFKAYCY